MPTDQILKQLMALNARLDGIETQIQKMPDIIDSLDALTERVEYLHKQTVTSWEKRGIHD